MNTTTFTFKNIHHTTSETLSIQVEYAGTFVIGIRKAASRLKISGFDWICLSHDSLTGAPRRQYTNGLTATLNDELTGLTEAHGFQWEWIQWGISITGHQLNFTVKGEAGDQGISFTKLQPGRADRLKLVGQHHALDTIIDLAEEIITDFFQPLQDSTRGQAWHQI